MRWFSRLIGNKDVPEWAGAFRSTRDFEEFKALVENMVTDRLGEGRLDWEEGVWKGDSGLGTGYQLGFYNLARDCSADDPSNWPSNVEMHFEKIYRAMSEDKRELTFEEVRDRLGPRILDPQLESDYSYCVFRSIDLGPLFIAAVQIDGEDSVSMVSDRNLEQWGMSETEVWEIAMANLRRQPTLTLLKMREDLNIFVAEDQHFQTASHLLCLDRYPITQAEYGVLVAVPVCDSLSILTINSKEDIRLGGALAGMALNLYKTESGEITPHLIWWRNGEMKPCYFDPEKRSIQCAPELVELINSTDG